MMSGIFRAFHIKDYPLVFVLYVCASTSALAESCDPLPGNEYEKIFCQLKRTGKGESLPSIYDFRKNPPLTQAFLLKKPAERAGIALRIPERNNVETVNRQADLLLEMSVPTTVPPVQQKLAVQKSMPAPLSESPPAVSKVVSKPAAQIAAVPERPVSPAMSETAPDVLASCTWQAFELHCANGHFRLVTNQTNQYLPEGVLSDAHKLQLPVFEGDASDRAAVDRYLQRAYRRYLEGMMEIGLGASTMSYTKFVRLYDHITGQKLDFVARFETMYHFLKQDKATIGVSTKPVIAEGFTTRYCSELTPELLACEHQRDNHVFIKTKTSG